MVFGAIWYVKDGWPVGRTRFAGWYARFLLDLVDPPPWNCDILCFIGEMSSFLPDFTDDLHRNGDIYVSRTACLVINFDFPKTDVLR